MKVSDILNGPAYPAVVAAAGALGGAAGWLIGEAVEKALDGGEGGWEEPSYSELPPIPEGVNVRDPEGEKVLDELFVKPDISKAIDYTRFHSKLENGFEVVKEEEDPSVFEIIEEAEFVKASGNGDGFVQATATYFTQDRILAGWNEDLVEKDVGTSVGSAAIAMFDDPEVKAVYVRNPKLKVLFEIVRCDDPMDEVIMETKVQEADAAGA